MKKIKVTSNKNYVQKNPKKAKQIKEAVKKGMKEYRETFKRLTYA